MKYLGVFLLFVFVLPTESDAQEFIGGEIWATEIEPYSNSFEINIDFYIKGDGQFDNPFQQISFGDGTFGDAALVSTLQVEEDIWLYRYYSVHTYPGTGFYNLMLIDSTFELPQFENIENQGTQAIVFSYLLRSANVFGPRTPPLFNFPITDAYFDSGVYYADASATELNGDPLIYLFADLSELAYPGYTFPAPSIDLIVIETTGVLNWDKPTIPGKYLISIQVEYLYGGGSEVRRYLVIDVTEEDISTSTSTPPSTTLEIFPNPTTDYLHIQVSGFENNPDYQLILSDLQGRILQEKSGTIFNGQLQDQVLDVGSLPPGIYQVLFRFDGYELMKRVVVE